jgi:hypothetical protein
MIATTTHGVIAFGTIIIGIIEVVPDQALVVD